MKIILVTGGSGQLASCIKDLEDRFEDYKFLYVDYDKLDITNEQEVINFFDAQNIHYCINCAAYTAVDLAESEKELTKSVNETGVGYLAKSCKAHNTTLIQISTDFVFDGKKSTPYKESDETNPLSIYGVTKLNGEEKAASLLNKYFILRTSWLYSEHGKNFLNTMLRLGKEKDQLSVVCDQIGTPTYAGDLANVILKLIVNNEDSYGTYHYSNEGVASWYDFAKAIFDENQTKIKLLPIKTVAYPTPAMRPSYSVLDKSKIKEVLNIEIPYWRDSMKECLRKLK